MRILLVAVLAVGLATPTAAQKAVVPPPGEHEPARAGAKKASSEADLAAMMAMFDKIFPAGPEPSPERLALARSTAAGVLPTGTYAAMFNEMMSGLVDRVLTINPQEFVPKAGKGKAMPAASLREEIARNDPHFDERMRIVRQVIGEELLKISAIIEPRLREGLARSIARRFEARQLGEINAFLATDTGRAFGAQAIRMWVDPEVMRSMMQGMPEMMKSMPAAMARVEAATAHLPKPKPRKAAAKKG